MHRPDPLLQHITDRVLDRLEDCLAKFPTAVVLGGAGDLVAEGLANGRAGVEKIIHIDSSPGMLALAKVSGDIGKPGVIKATSRGVAVHDFQKSGNCLLRSHDVDPATTDSRICSIYQSCWWHRAHKRQYSS
jgi:hypothetical protein